MFTAGFLTLLGTVLTGPGSPTHSSASLPSAGFGRTVLVVGDNAFVGEATGAAPGRVFIYRRLPTGWKRVDSLRAPNTNAGDGFGRALAGDASTLLVGQWRQPPAGGRGGGRGAAPAPAPADTAVGVVQVFTRAADGKWRSAGSLPAATPAGTQFGSTIALSGSVAMVGAPVGAAGGSVAVFQRGADGKWAARGALPASDLVAGDRFGAAIAIDGNRAAVGAPGRTQRGAVYLFTKGTDGSWALDRSVSSRRSPENAQFGSALMLNGDKLTVGAPGAAFAAVGGVAPVPGRGGAGATPPTDRTTARIDSLRARSPELAMIADSLARLAAAARQGQGGGRGGAGGGAGMGMVVAFTRSPNGAWVEGAQVVTPYDFPASAGFGSALAVVGNELWVGAPTADGAGRIYRVQQDKDGAVTGMSKLMTNDAVGGRGSQFAATFAVAGGTVVVGMPGDAGNLGTVAFLGKSASGDWITRTRDFPEVQDRFAAVTGKEVVCDDKGMAATFQCGNTGLLSFLPIQQLGGDRTSRMNDNWGWTDPLTGKEYALAGRNDGTAFVDVTDPTHPVYLGNLPKTPGTPSGVWRDIKTYKNHAYIVADGSGQHGMQVFDLTRLRTVKTPQIFRPDVWYDRIASAHNIVINEGTGYAYAVGVNGAAPSAEGGDVCGGSLHMIDIRTPKKPVFAGCFADGKTGRAGTGYSHDAVCINYHGPDTKYTGREICVGSNETAISIADVTDKKNPKSLSTISYPNVAYAHQGWFTEDHKYFFLDDEGDEIAAQSDTTGKNKAKEGTRTMIYDVSKLDDPVLAKEYVGPVKSSDHNLYIKGNKLYMANYGSGLRIVDISDPLNPREVAFMDTYPDDDNGPAMHGAWSNYPYFKSGTIIVTSVTEGLFLVKDRSKVTVP